MSTDFSGSPRRDPRLGSAFRRAELFWRATVPSPEARVGLDRGFVNNEHAAVHPPPAVQLFRSSGGFHAPRLKIAVALYLAGAHAPEHTLAVSAHELAELIGLAPGEPSLRRTRDALAVLAAWQVITLERRQGRPSLVTLRAADGSGGPFRPPWSSPGGYVDVPWEFVPRAWLAALSGRALSALWAIADTAVQLVGRAYPIKAAVPLWARRDRYGLGEDNWQLGVRELAAHDLVRVHVQFLSTKDGRTGRRYELKVRRSAFGAGPTRIVRGVPPRLVEFADIAHEVDDTDMSNELRPPDDVMDLQAVDLDDPPF